jgi:release factor glutamine methyltransferase
LKKEEPSKFFHYKELVIELHPEVYEPAEDTFLLLEAIGVKKDQYVLEIGTGCGLIALECARVGANVVCSDINPFAIDLVKRNYKKNKHLIKGSFEVRKGDLFSVIKENEKFDIIIFNPPYLPTKVDELVGGLGWFDIATDGGLSGLKVTKKFIEEISKYLSKEGKGYFVFSSLSDRKKLSLYLTKARLKADLVLSRCFNDERLDVYCVFN